MCSRVISRRYEYRSIILTANRGIAEWGHIFEDTTVASAVLDHSSSVRFVTGDSYRMRRHGDAVQRKRARSGARCPVVHSHADDHNDEPRTARASRSPPIIADSRCETRHPPGDLFIVTESLHTHQSGSARQAGSGRVP
jgi:hypothetical protein